MRFKGEVGGEIFIRRSEAEWLEGFKLRRGSLLSVQDEGGRWFRARVIELSEKDLRAVVFEEMIQPAESNLFLVLIQAIPSRERMELIIEKASELGADQVQPVFTARSYLLKDLAQNKERRWQDRARKAAEQCRRGMVPRVFEPRSLEAGSDLARGCDLKLVLDEGESKTMLSEILEARKGTKSCVLAVGPEGGWEQAETDLLKRKGYIGASLGGRLLRVETAAITGLAMVQSRLGDLGRAE